MLRFAAAKLQIWQDGRGQGEISPCGRNDERGARKKGVVEAAASPPPQQHSVLPDLQSGSSFRILNAHTRRCQITNLAGRKFFTMEAI